MTRTATNATLGSALALLLVAAIGPAGAQSPGDKSEYNLFNPVPDDQLREMTLDGPGATESPHTVDAGHFQIELTFFGRSSYEDKSEGVIYSYDWWGIGPVNLKLGLFRNLDVQLILEPYARAIEKETGSARIERAGYGDTSLRFKVNLWGNDDGKTALALIPYFKFPTSQEGLGNENLEGGLVLPFALALPGEFYLGLTTTFAKVQATSESSYHTEYQNSISIARALGDRVDAYVEFYSLVSTQDDTPWIGTINTGLGYWLTDDWQLNAAVEIGATNWADDWYFGVGMAWRY
jgi:hypothetical protein